jgi:hypothetical protein
MSEPVIIAFMTGPKAETSGINFENHKEPIDAFVKRFAVHDERPGPGENGDPDRKNGPWVAGVTGARRENDSLYGHGRALLFDFDKINDAEWQTIRSRLQAKGWRYVAYSSWSCRPGKLKLRVILFTDREMMIGKEGINVETISKIKAAISKDIFDGKAAAESHKPAQIFYLPSHDGSPEARAAAFCETGGDKLLDPSGYLAEALQGGPRPGFDAFSAAGAGNDIEERAAKIAKLRNDIRTGEDFHEAMKSLIPMLRFLGHPRTDVELELRALMLDCKDTCKDANRWQSRYDDIPRMVDTCGGWTERQEAFQTKEGNREKRRQKAAEQPVARKLRCAKMSTFKTRTVKYLLNDPDMLPRKLLSLLCGPTGVGKSQSALHYAACITRGVAFERGDKSRFTAQPVRPPADVVIVAGEDTIEEMVKPRAVVAGVDVNRVHMIEGVDVTTAGGKVELQRFSLEHAAADLEALLSSDDGKNIKLVIIDPIQDFVGKIDANHNNEVRAALTPLVMLAQRYDLAILMVHHCRKDVKIASVLDACQGSTAFAEVPKFIVMMSPEDRSNEGENRFIFQVVKTSSDRAGFRVVYEIESVPLTTDDGDVAHVARFNILEDEEATVSIFQAISGQANREQRTKQEEAEAFLQEHVTAPIESKIVIAAAKDDGISERTLKRARKDLKMPSVRTGFGEATYWFPAGVTVSDAKLALPGLLAQAVQSGQA